MSQKRKLNEHDNNYRKKRKLSRNDISDKLKKLNDQANNLIKERNYFQDRYIIYKKESNKWKSQYIKLYSQLYGITNTKPITIPTNNNTNINTNENECQNSLTPSPTPPPKKYFHKPKHTYKRKNNKTQKTKSKCVSKKKRKHRNKKTKPMNIIISNNSNANYDSVKKRLLQMGFNKTDVINRISLYIGSGQSPQFVFNQLIHTFTDNTHTSKNPTKDNCKDNHNDKIDAIPKPMDLNNDKNDINYNSQYVDFENSYYIAINCHICEKHFQDINKYKNHIKMHYLNDTNKIWKTCDLGCNLQTENDMYFIKHIATHTNNYPFKCNIKINGNKCNVSKGYKYDMKLHWKSHFKITENNKNDSEYFKQIPQTDNNNDKHIDFENSYHIYVKCHLCKKYFQQFDAYTKHLQNHYESHINKIWLKCEFPHCKKKRFENVIEFVSHIAIHTCHKPFKCDMIIKGIKCQSECTSKSKMKQHYLSHIIDKSEHNLRRNKRVKRQINYKPTPIARSNNNKEYVRFEDSFHVSINCHICSEYFDNFEQYKYHLKEHYENDSKTTWKLCNFGCKIDPKKPLFSSHNSFISHISQHTNEKPFKCHVIVNGKKCESQYGSKTQVKDHWQKHFEYTDHKSNKSKRKSNDTTPDISFELNANRYNLRSHNKICNDCLD